MVTPFSYYDLLEMFARPGCGVCHLLLRDADQHLDSILYEYVVDVDTNQAFRRSRGLCNEHGWQMLNYFGGKLGAAILFHASVDEVLKILNQQAGVRNRIFSRKSGGLAEKLLPSAGCMICQLQNRNEKTYLEVFVQYLGDEKLQAAYRQSDGLCLPHFRQALALNPPDADTLIHIQRDLWTQTRADLVDFIENSVLLEGDDKERWQRAVRQLCGEKGVFGARKL